ncbi:unnamed protein product [Scytosiphon promiscuus]
MIRGNLEVKMESSTDAAREDDYAEGLGEGDTGIAHLREATSGSLPELPQQARRTYQLQNAEAQGALKVLRRQSGTPSLVSTGSVTDSGDGTTIAEKLDSGETKGRQKFFSEEQPPSGLVPPRGRTDDKPLRQTPMRLAPASITPKSGAGGTSSNGFASSAVSIMTPPTKSASNAAEEASRRGDEQSLRILASLYVHIMIRRFVPSLATEMHLTIRLLHVHSDVARRGGGRTATLEHDRQESLAPSRTLAVDSPVDRTAKVGEESLGIAGDEPGKNVVFKTGLDCRFFAAHVLRGLKSLLPHLGTDMLDLLAGSLALASQSQEVIAEVNACKANADVKDPRKKRQQNTDDTAIVQSVGAPFAALQWREEDSVNNFRTTSDRSLFQNRQESVDRFGSLLREYQASRKGLQQYPERALQDLSRTAASAMICGLAPENQVWLAQYFLSQLVGWGLSPPEETDSEVMALVAPAGDKGRATLQKLHRRISTPSFGEDGNALKSSQKLRHPGTLFREAHAPQDRGSCFIGGTRGPSTGVQQPRSRKCSTGPRHSKGERLISNVRVPTAPLQLRWFPGNQEFFYHIILVLDSYTFNSHLKAEFAAEIHRLYFEQDMIEMGKNGVGHIKEVAGTSDRSNSAAGEGVKGFTGTMVKLKVLAKFLGLLTFCPNWGVLAPDATSTSTTHGSTVRSVTEKAPTTCPLPLETYLNHAWSTAGLVGAVPWMADFMRMMKWDEVASQASYYRRILGTLARLHAQPCMRPEHPAFTEPLLAVSCEVESLFQDLGSDLGVHGYRFSSLASESVIDFDSPGQTGKGAFAEPPKIWSGSLDEEVLLTRRFIQNCCPYLEDVLTLIRSLGRAWKLGTIAGGCGTPFRGVQSPRLIGASGMSPRRRVIKPHPLKSMRVLPSLHEHLQRAESAGEEAGTGRGIMHMESTRLRLVEAFFHHLPGELQGIADFVVRHAVQNACEEVSTEVIRPAIAAVGCLHLASNKMDKILHVAPAAGSMASASVASLGRGVLTRHKVDALVARTTAALDSNLESEARRLAGNRGKAVAVTTAMALVPHSLSMRVRQTAAAIAGRHAKHAAERKVREAITSTILETVGAYSTDHEPVQSILAHSKSTQKGVGSWSQDILLPKVPEQSELCTFAAILLESASNFVLTPTTESTFMGAVHRVSMSNANDIPAFKSVVRETLHLVQRIGRFRRSYGVAGESDGAVDAKKKVGTLEKAMPSERARQRPHTLRKFLLALARFYRALPDHQHDVWHTVRISFPPSCGFGNAFEELILLAATEWERDAPMRGRLVGSHGESSQKGGPVQDSRLWLPPWDPLSRLLSWGLAPILTAENALLSSIQHASVVTRPELGERDVTHSAKFWHAVKPPSREGLVAVATAVAKGYHNLGSGEDLSTALLPDLSRKHNSGPVVNAAAKPFNYHPMHLCRLIARLRMMEESVQV